MQAEESTLSIRMIYIIILLFFVLIPVYILPSGGFQLVDLTIILAMVHASLTIRTKEFEPGRLVVMLLALYVSWAILVNIIHFLFKSELFFMKATAQLVLIAFMFGAFVVLFQKTILRRGGVLCIYIGLLLSLIPPFFVTGSYDVPTTEGVSGVSIRSALSFNNPNQLGYFALLVLTILFLVRIYAERFEYTRLQARLMGFIGFVVFVMTHLFTVFSASRAALISMAFLDIFICWKFRKQLIVCLLCLLFFVPPTLFAFSDKLPKFDILVFQRLLTTDVESAMSRRVGSRFFQSLGSEIAIVCGAGGVSNNPKVVEVHNAFADMVLCYGIIGLGLFLLFLSAVLLPYFLFIRRYDQLYYPLLMGPVLLYNVAHNGLRFRLFWIFVALWFAVTRRSMEMGMEEGEAQNVLC